ncbi:alpha/beta hydrolase [Streptomyces longwoodensis]|uniref:alpha/beta fold hydrolase n=1 Tax=Streptomyces longwoodensis TaxID=68231 RepID=UPI003251B992
MPCAAALSSVRARASTAHGASSAALSPAAPGVTSFAVPVEQAWSAPAAPPMGDPTLRPGLAVVTVPTLVLWGESDPHGGAGPRQGYAASFPPARFELVAEAGHLPHLDQPEHAFALLDALAARSARLRR